ncbi:hypothetical protein CBL_01957 [Carabus blaptoides fortunei]
MGGTRRRWFEPKLRTVVVIRLSETHAWLIEEQTRHDPATLPAAFLLSTVAKSRPERQQPSKQPPSSVFAVVTWLRVVASKGAENDMMEEVLAGLENNGSNKQPPDRGLHSLKADLTRNQPLAYTYSNHTSPVSGGGGNGTSSARTDIHLAPPLECHA